MAKLTREQNLEKMRRHWAEAERGIAGLKKVRAGDFYGYPAHRWPELLTEPVILYADLEEVCVVMSLEDYFSQVHNPKGGKSPLMRRIDGILYREVV